jgi:hypothetical protein
MNTKIICSLPLVIVLCFTFTAFANPPPPPPPPPPPTNLKVTAVPGEPQKLLLTWDDVAGETGYKIQRRRAPDLDNWYIDIQTLTANTVSYIDTGLPNANTYYYRVIAFNGSGNSSPSNEDYNSPWRAIPVISYVDAQITPSEQNLNCAYFDGDSGYITVQHDPVLNFGTEDFTICFWTKFGYDAYSGLLNKMQEYDLASYEIFFSFGGHGPVYVWLNASFYDGTNGIFFDYPIDDFLNDDRWHFIAYSIDRSGQAVFYFDGIPVSSADGSVCQNNISNDAGLIIGNNPNLFGIFDGSLDDIRIYKKALSQTEIAAIYNNGNGTVCSDNSFTEGTEGFYMNFDQAFDGDQINGRKISAGTYSDWNGTISGDVTQVSGGVHREGHSWGTAYKYLNDALTASELRAGDEVWVADGTYYPDQDKNNTSGTGSPAASFIVKEGVSVYGGFGGDEIIRDERNWVNNAAVLNGDIGQQNNPADNVYHILTMNDNSIVDGFTVIDGNARSAGNNKGGGAFCTGKKNATLRNSIFLGNQADSGGGVYNESGSITINNCVFSSNQASTGGAIYNKDASASILNATFSINSATVSGGGIYNDNAKTSVINCILWANTAPSDPAIRNVNSSNPYISYSDIAGWSTGMGVDGGHNIDADPQFVNADGNDNTAGTLDDNVHLGSSSPCIATGLGGEDRGMNWPVDSNVIASATLTNPVDVVVDSASGNVYVLSSSLHTVYMYDANLSPLSPATFTVDATNPMALCLDGSGNVYIADTGGNRILRYTPAGVLDTTFDSDGIVGESGTGDGQFDQPWGIAVDWSGYVYVTDSVNDRVQVFDSIGAFVRKWGQPGSGDGQLDGPAGLYLLGTSNVFVAEAVNHRIQNLSTYGYFFGKIGSYGSGAGQFNTPRDISYDLNYNQLIVADTANNRLQIFQLSGYGGFGSNESTFVKKINGQNFSGPMGVACASTDTQQIIYVADTGNGRVIRLQVEQEQPARTPLHVFELFKAALWNDDLDKALTFFADTASDKYAIALSELRPHFRDMVTGIGDMILMSIDDDRAKYEMLHDEGGGIIASYPVYFSKDENGDWKIYCF